MTRPPTLTEQVLAQLRAAVLSGELEPGRRYSATGLAERFGVSRTPVREALLELERSGMARIDKNRGVTVVPSSLEEIVNCYQLRLVLEAPAAARAAANADEDAVAEVEAKFQAMQEAADAEDIETLLRADRDFHSALVAVAENQRLVKVLEDLRNLVLTTGIATVPASRTCQELVEDHRDILEAVQSGDPQAAAAAMRRHVHNTAVLLIRREAAERQRSGDPAAHQFPGAQELEAKLLSFELTSFTTATGAAETEPQPG
ncbi:GntR family transcriptional regulator [Nesterenkonia sp. MY13]|uniref:GntR family transcriptional regulator n=1 Tax=Nesterenkonia sedimenti TaxID=1463632 RepID=A0A7X8YDV9_9MICC|nr:GntR family transcriptional regulator [Nesterenkonia sedimenti]NLS09577.1 GntR family transcriptional regulator [Nesterenkonia sedimenti]